MKWMKGLFIGKIRLLFMLYHTDCGPSDRTLTSGFILAIHVFNDIILLEEDDVTLALWPCTGKVPRSVFKSRNLAQCQKSGNIALKFYSSSLEISELTKLLIPLRVFRYLLNILSRTPSVTEITSGGTNFGTKIH